MKRFFSIAKLKLLLEYEAGAYDIFLDEALRNFAASPFETPDIRFLMDTKASYPALDSYKEIFTSAPHGLWRILEDSAKSCYIVSLQSIPRDSVPYKIVSADRRFADFTVFSRPTWKNVLFPLEYPLDELAISGYLNINKIGIILHSACIALEGKGILFSGVSGSGKSTISQIWQKDREARVLTDERVIIREMGDNLWAFGTPWHGTAKVHKNAGIPIEKIFFIKHGERNRAVPISKAEAANRLMVRCFPTFWNQDGMQYVLDLCTQIATEIECCDLEFVNDFSITKYIKEARP